MICLDTNIVIAIVNARSLSFRHRLGELMRGGTPAAVWRRYAIVILERL